MAAAAAMAATRLAGAADLTLGLHGARVRVSCGGDAARVALVTAWIRKSADAVVVYYGKFPVPEVNIAVTPMEGAGVGGGQTFPGHVPHIRVGVGAAAGEDALMHADWVMVHEMIHLAFPWMDGEHNWMAEGIAVYVESIARVQAGHLEPRQIWGDFVRAMPRGLPQEGDKGLDGTPTWGRTYWGGALFCLQADIAIRQHTDNRKGLRDALRAINATRDFRKQWDFGETLAIGDKATGGHVLRDLYAANRAAPVMTDLDALWKSLGVLPDGGFDDKAPLAAIRLAITKA